MSVHKEKIDRLTRERDEARAHQDKWLASQTAEELRNWIRKNACLCDMAGICNGCKRADAEYEARQLRKQLDTYRKQHNV